MSRFQLVGLPHESFEPLFAWPDEKLHEMGARRVIAPGTGYPCRVSLEDAAVGEELLLLPFTHQPALSPYRASGPIFVRRGARQRILPPGEVPPYVTDRLISVRAYDATDSIVAAEVREGPQVRSELERQFGDANVAYIHLHNARRGCFSCLVRRC